jgi:hypothetical protein
VEGVALRPQRGELGDEPVPLDPEGVGVDPGAAAAEGVDRVGGDQGALRAGLADRLAGQAARLEVAPDGALGDLEGLRRLGDGDGVGGGDGVHGPTVRRRTPDSLSEPGVRGATAVSRPSACG